MSKTPTQLFEDAAELLLSSDTRPVGLRTLAAAAMGQRNALMAIEALGQITDRQSGVEAADLFTLARAHFMRGDTPQCIELLDTLIDAGEQDLATYHLRSVAHLFSGRVSAALLDARAGVALSDRSNEQGQVQARRAEWLMSYLAGLRGDEDLDNPYAHRALVERWRGKAPPANVPIVAAMDYKSPELSGASTNIGDVIQTAAALRHLARITNIQWSYDDGAMAPVMRRLASSWSDSESISGAGRVHLAIFDRDFPYSVAYRFPHRTVWAIYNGWFNHSVFDCSVAMPAPLNLQPLVLSFHLARPQDLNAGAIDWLRSFAPIGCRDWSTVYWLANQGVECFFSGCLTLTLASSTIAPSRFGRYLVDSPPDVGDKDGIFVQHSDIAMRRSPLADTLEEALDLLDRYGAAESIKTSRLHCALPALALGASVELDLATASDRRFEGLIGATKRERGVMSACMSGLLARTLPAILAGDPVDEVRALWRLACAEPVAETIRRLEDFGITRGPLKPEPSAEPLDVRGHVTIALAFDANYVDKARVVLRSIRANTKAELHVVLLVRGVAQFDAERVASVAEPAETRVMPMDGWLTGVNVELVRDITFSTMDRLSLPELLPEVDRIVYLDCDTVVLGDIAELAAIDTGSTGIAARATPNLNLVNIAQAVERRAKSLAADRAIELRRWAAAHTDLSASYFNAGVLVMSLARLRETKMVERATDLITKFELNDQDTLNLVAGGRYGRLPMRWNVMPNSDFCESPSLIHWIGAAKPWGKKPVRFADHWRRFQPMEPPASPIDREHWLNPESYQEAWEKRAKMAGGFIAENSHVLDVGAGARLALKIHLPPGCRYTPADMRAWTEEVLVVDLEQGQFPPGRFDVVVLLGVLEYLSKPGFALQKARKAADRLVVSYCHPRPNFSAPRRRELGWVNAMREVPFAALLARVGWRIHEKVEYNNNAQIRQIIYSCVADAPNPAAPTGDRSAALAPPPEPILGPTAVAVREERLTYLRPSKMARLENALSEMIRVGVKGDFVEFGVALGGSAIVMAEAARADGRAFIGLDVFAMIPPPRSEKDDDKSKARFAEIASGQSRGIKGDVYYGYRGDLLADVTAAFRRHGLTVDGETVVLEKGLFTDTWSAHAERDIAMAHVDCDWYESVRFCLSMLRRQLSPGGLIVVDDYHDWSGARAATDEFLAANSDFSMSDGDNVVLKLEVRD